MSTIKLLLTLLVTLFITGCVSNPVKNAGTQTVREFDKDGKIVSEKVTRTDYAEYLQSFNAKDAPQAKYVEIDCGGKEQCFSGKLTIYAQAPANQAAKPVPQPPIVEDSEGWKVYREIKGMVVGLAKEAKDVALGVTPYKYGARVLESAFNGANQPRDPTYQIDMSEGSALAFNGNATGQGRVSGRINSNDTRTNTRTRTDTRTNNIDINCSTGSTSNPSTVGATSPANGAPSGTNNCPVTTNP